jgi:hypothetical protein
MASVGGGDVLEVLIGKMGKDRDVDAVPRKCAGVLGQADFMSQSVISCIAAHARLNFGLVDPLDGGFYPIDRAARNLPERSAAGVTGGPPQIATDGRRPRIHRGRRLQPMPICAPFGLFRSYKPFPCTEGQNMVTSAERMRRCASASAAGSAN